MTAATKRRSTAVGCIFAISSTVAASMSSSIWSMTSSLAITCSASSLSRSSSARIERPIASSTGRAETKKHLRQLLDVLVEMSMHVPALYPTHSGERRTLGRRYNPDA